MKLCHTSVRPNACRLCWAFALRSYAIHVGYRHRMGSEPESVSVVYGNQQDLHVVNVRLSLG